MSTQGDDEGLVDVFVKGVVFTLGAAAAGVILRKVFRQQPEVVVVAVAAEELGGDEDDGGELDEDGSVDGRDEEDG